MKIRILMIAFLGIALMAQAQSFGNNNQNQTQSQRMMQTGARYSGVVYEPFTGSVPSEQSAVGASYSPAKGGRVRRGFDTGADFGGSEESPVGDAVLPLLLAAACYGLFLLRRKRLAANR